VGAIFLKTAIRSYHLLEQIVAEIATPLQGETGTNLTFQVSEAVCKVSWASFSAGFRCQSESLYTQPLRDECSEGYLAERLGLDLVATHRLVQERQGLRTIFKASDIA